MDENKNQPNWIPGCELWLKELDIMSDVWVLAHDFNDFKDTEKGTLIRRDEIPKLVKYLIDLHSEGKTNV